MQQPIVLVIFYSRAGSTEKLALAAAVGAVQGRALIRLRRLPDLNAAKVIEAFPDAREALVRMHREYVAPAEADILAADAIIFATPPDLKTSDDWKPHLDMLARLRSEGKMEGKVVVPLSVDSVQRATEQGRAVAAMVHEIKNTK